MRRLLLAATALLALALLALVPQPASAQYSPMFITVDPTVVEVGGTITVRAGYFEPGSDVQIRVESDPVVLGTLVADASGVVTSSFALPLSVGIGSHVVFALGPRLGTGVATEVSAAITVIDASVSPTAVVPGPGSTGSLPATGRDLSLLLTVGAALVVGGGLAIQVTRRRSTRRT
jgi:LPXTG-motif cell wall-anchored protein